MQVKNLSKEIQTESIVKEFSDTEIQTEMRNIDDEVQADIECPQKIETAPPDYSNIIESLNLSLELLKTQGTSKTSTTT